MLIISSSNIDKSLFHSKMVSNLNSKVPESEFIYLRSSNTECDRNTSNIFKSHVCVASELRQVVMVAPSSYYLTMFIILFTGCDINTSDI